MHWWEAVPRLRDNVLAWLDSVRYPGAPWGLHRYCVGMKRPWAIESTCAAIKILRLYDALDDVPAADRHALGAFIRSHQNARTGLVEDPLIGGNDRVSDSHPWEHIWGRTTGVVMQTLPLLGTQLPVIKLLPDEPRAPEDVPGWLEGLPWRGNPWRCGTLIGQFMARHRAREGRLDSAEEDGVVAAVMNWLETHQDPITGLWGTNRGGELHKAMAGLHCMSTGTYYLPCRPMPRPERIIDAVLSLQDADGNFAGGGGCLNYDAVKDLASAARTTDHRRADIIAAVRLMADRALAAYRKPDGAFSFFEREPYRTHGSIFISDVPGESDMVGTHMYTIVLRECASMEHGLDLPPAF